MWGWIIGGVVLLLASSTNENNDKADRNLHQAQQKRDRNRHDLEMKFKAAGQRNFEAIAKNMAKIDNLKEADIEQLLMEVEILGQRILTETNSEMKKRLRKQSLFLRKKLRQYN